MMKVTPISFNMQAVQHARYYSICKNEQKRYLIEIRFQAKTIGTIFPKVHGIDKGVDSNLRSEKQIIKALVTPVQSHVSTESKDQCHVKPSIGQGKKVIKKKMLRFSYASTI